MGFEQLAQLREQLAAKAKSERNAKNERNAKGERGAQNERNAKDERGAQNERNAKGERGAQNERNAKGERGGQNERNAKGERGGQNERNVKNERGAKQAQARPNAQAKGKPSTPVEPVVLAISRLQKRFPQAFPKNPAPKLPLKVGIWDDLAAQAQTLGLDDAELREAIATWCRGYRYWSCLVEGAVRVDLQGNEAGRVTAADAARARQLKARRPAKAASQAPAQQPEAQKSEAQQPEAQQLEAQQPEAQQLEVQQPEAQQPETQQLEVRQPEAQQPESQLSEHQQPEPQQSDTPQPEKSE
ncbi:ProQ/FinO family protein [Burkholderia guangdongensis]|uniref:ProQ/FinO family protein n=1 Tax=Burkholderia guangdongensis TaxID=1792500 RepID=UPI0015C88271|nr:ProQ/FinO family protein [Burkholderia guangdongensis]